MDGNSNQACSQVLDQSEKIMMHGKTLALQMASACEDHSARRWFLQRLTFAAQLPAGAQ
jgi:hypothetical protein